MSRFIKVPAANGKEVVINTDNVLFASETENGVFLTFHIKESGQHDGLNIAMTLTEFLILANDEV